jgi:NitT/TauT family transport system ATP-binding protein
MAHAATNAPIVALRGVGKTFASGVTAIDRLDLDVRGGELVSLLGPSGCGKSTALRIIAGLSEPSRGAVNWADDGGTGRPRSIGFVFQEPTLMPWATVFGNGSCRRSRHRPEAPRVMAMLEGGAAEFAAIRANFGGMRMRRRSRAGHRARCC